MVRAGAFRAGFHPSAIATATDTLAPSGQAAPPTIVPTGGRFPTKQTVTMTASAGAIVRYTTTGVDPTENDPIVPTGGITVDRAQTVKARAWVSGSSPSAVRRADFVIMGALASGHQHSVAVASEGTQWAWGRGTEGQLGNNTTSDSSTPVSALTNIKAVAGGERHSLAVHEDGTVRAFGRNSSGQLGDGTTSPRLTPVQTLGLTNVIAVAGGYDHSLALKSDGTVWSWGT